MKIWMNTSKRAVNFHFSLVLVTIVFNNSSGVPYIPRKMMCASSPLLEIRSNEQGEWTISSSTFFRNVVITFKLGEEYEENMPGGVVIKVSANMVNRTFGFISNCICRAPQLWKKTNYPQYRYLRTAPR